MATKYYGINDKWTDDDLANVIEVASEDGTVNSVKVNGVEYGGGGGGYELIASGEFECSTTSADAIDIQTVYADVFEPNNEIIMIVIRDKAGRRTGYFYESFSLYFNYPGRNTTVGTTDYAVAFRMLSATNMPQLGYSSMGNMYGIYVREIKKDASDRQYFIISARYNNNSSRTIDGTYIYEAYRLSYPPGADPNPND